MKSKCLIYRRFCSAELTGVSFMKSKDCSENNPMRICPKITEKLQVEGILQKKGSFLSRKVHFCKF